MKSSVLVALAFLLLTAVDPPKRTAPTYLESLEVTVGNLDVVVTDRAGNPIRGLQRGDFEVREGGEPRTITNFSEFATASATAQLNTAAPATAPVVATEAPPPRKFVFFVDEMSIHPESRKKLEADAHALIETQMRPGDEAMIVTPANATLGTLTFTADRGAIDAQLRTLIEKSVFRADTTPRAEQFFYDTAVQQASGAARRQMARIYATKVNRRVTSTLRALLGVVGMLTRIEDKKVLVVLSESLSAEPGREAFMLGDRLRAASQNVTPDEFSGRTEFDTNSSTGDWFDARPMIAELAARASANGITIYSIQPDPGFAIAPPGLPAGSHAPRLEPIGAVTGASLPPTSQLGGLAGGSAVASFQRQISESTAETLGSLADATGGKFWRGIGELDDAFTTIASDINAYYSIGYRVVGTSDDRIRKIDVAVKNRPDLDVRTRRSILRYSPEREMGELATAELLSAKNINELDIVASAAKPQRVRDAYKIDVAVKIPLDKLTFIPEGADKYEAQFTVHYAAADGANYTMGETRRQTLRVPAKEIDTVRTHTYTYTSTLMVAPGTARISVGVFDTLSRLSGFRRLSVEAR